MEGKEERSVLLPGKRRRQRNGCRGYQFVWVRSKGAHIVILLTALGQLEFAIHSEIYGSAKVRKTYYAVLAAILPIFGLFTDIRFGRFNTLVALAVAKVFLSGINVILVVIHHAMTEYPSVIQNTALVYTVIWYVKLPIAICFSVVSFTFGLDQLLDAPSSN